MREFQHRCVEGKVNYLLKATAGQITVANDKINGQITVANDKINDLCEETERLEEWRQQKMIFDAQDFVEVRSGVDDVVDALNQMRADVGVGEAAPRRCGSKGIGMNNAVAL